MAAVEQLVMDLSEATSSEIETANLMGNTSLSKWKADPTSSLSASV